MPPVLRWVPPLVISLYIQMLLSLLEIIVIVSKESDHPFSNYLSSKIRNTSIDVYGLSSVKVPRSRDNSIWQIRFTQRPA